MPDRPLLIFPSKTSYKNIGTPRFVPDKMHRPEVRSQKRRIAPQFNNVLESYISDNAVGLHPEHVIVLETTCRIDEFKRITNNIEGLDWLTEIDVEIEPDDNFFNTEKPEKILPGRLYLSMSNRQGLDRLIRLFNLWDGSRNSLPKGLKPLNELFSNIKTLRFWNEYDRMENTGLLDVWKENLDYYKSENLDVKFDIHLWYNSDSNKRQSALEQVVDLIHKENGNVIKFCEIQEVQFLALKAELPAAAIEQITNLDFLEVFKSDFIYQFRPVGQSLVEFSEGSFQQEFVESESRGEPIAALLDGYPFSNHTLLRNHVTIDDPDNFIENYSQVSDFKHGTQMASLICHGDLNSGEGTLGNKLYIRPILKPSLNSASRIESIPEDEFFEDILERAVRRIFEGSQDSEEGVAPTIKVINLSVCDGVQMFTRQMSSIAKVIDWLSEKYNVLFCVSAGNISDPILFNLSLSDFEDMEGNEIAKLTIEKIIEENRNRRILAPADSINALTIGCFHDDFSNIPERLGNRIDLMPDLQLASPISPLGFGYRNSIKPDILFPGGRQLYRYANPAASLSSMPQEPGQKVANAPLNQGDTESFVYSRGTSNSTAIATRSAVKIYKVLSELRDLYKVIDFDEKYFPVLMKALLVHSADWGVSRSIIENSVGEGMDNYKFRKLITKIMGYGVPNINRVLECTAQRATVLGFGEIKAKERQEFRFPIPVCLSGEREVRKLTITVAWFSPINSGNRKYRVANLQVEKPPHSALGTRRIMADWQQVKNGTVQHEVFEGNELKTYVDGEFLSIPVICKEDATGMSYPIKYGLAVTMEVAEGVALPVYEQVREKLNIPIAIE
ncbi:S8 family peptidase [Marinifilum fragile]|uniref:S8 family peptidase n=1 Tax=Marinifilum fragile TaxID=570161 RepID=UPI002AA6B7A9|nr:S8 family peptidase [Marinifilum fragile]